MGASSIGVCLAFAGLRPRATVRRSRISDVLVFTKCYKMLIKILGIFYSGEGGPRKRSCTPPVGGLRVRACGLTLTHQLPNSSRCWSHRKWC